MKLDLRQFITPIVKQIELRVCDFNLATNVSPGETGDTIHQIVLGFQFDQAAWVALVFDTRPDADPVYDGEWQSTIEENTLDCDVGQWMEAYEEIFENESNVTFTTVDGKTVKVGPYKDDDEDAEERLTTQLAELFGSVCRESLKNIQSRSLFSSMPLAITACLRVDEHECQYLGLTTTHVVVTAMTDALRPAKGINRVSLPVAGHPPHTTDSIKPSPSPRRPPWQNHLR
jgi:hypothetical protein